MSKHELIGERCKKYWGVIPIVVFVLVRIIVSLIEVSTDSALRSIPQMLLSWFGGISIAILVFWIGRSLFLEEQRTEPKRDSNITNHILRNILWGNYGSNWNRIFKQCVLLQP